MKRLTISTLAGLFLLVGAGCKSQCEKYQARSCEGGEDSARCKKAKMEIKGWQENEDRCQQAYTALKAELSLTKDKAFQSGDDFPAMDGDISDLEGLPGGEEPEKKK